MLEKGERGAQNGPTNLVVCCIARPWLFLKLVKLTKSQAVVSLTVASTNSREIFSLIGGVISLCFKFGGALENRSAFDAFEAKDGVTVVAWYGD
jgi:hypothetical protein